MECLLKSEITFQVYKYALKEIQDLVQSNIVWREMEGIKNNYFMVVFEKLN